MDHKYVYLFSEGNDSTKNLLDGEGTNLTEMTILGIPVPQGFMIIMEACTQYYNDGRRTNEEIQGQVSEYLTRMGEICGEKFGDVKNPLPASMRFGVHASMLGMIDTTLNLGLNDTVVEGLVALTSSPCFAYDSYRRFIQMFSGVVMEIPESDFGRAIDAKEEEKGVRQGTKFNTGGTKDLAVRFKALYRKKKGTDFPIELRVQLMEVVKVTFHSWDNPRANVYRRINEIPYDWGTAVNVQSTVFGNMGNTSGTDVAFTRNPATGEKRLLGEYPVSVQNKGVVAGIRTPESIDHLEDILPEAYTQPVETAQRLENHYIDMQNMEFTTENGKLYMLQTKNDKRTVTAALKIAADLVKEGKISIEEVALRVEPEQLDSLLHPQFDPAELKKAQAISKGPAAFPGAACDHVVFSAEDTKTWSDKGEKVVLVRLETSPGSIEGMTVAQDILTVRGGMTSHVAVIARGMGACCVSGCGEIVMHEAEKYLTLDGQTVHKGDCTSIDDSTGSIYGQAMPTVGASISSDSDKYMYWVGQVRRLQVHISTDTPRDAAQGKAFGVRGIGLCRTEHMFFEDDRIKTMREMVVAKTTDARHKTLAKLLPYQQSNFEGISDMMEELPAVICFTDPPLHEFLSTKEGDIKEISEELGLTVEELKEVITSLYEFDPIMGHRGRRLTVSHPGIVEMQTIAMITTTINIPRKGDINIVSEIMIPLVGEVKELKSIKDIVTSTVDKLIAESGISTEYEVGTMIEIPHTALTAGEIAKEANFSSFGTNDLTQMTFGFSHGDAGKSFDYYYENKIYESDSFAHIDQKGVGRFMEMAIERGRAANPHLHVGIRGEHGGDPTSVEFCHRTGSDYVSCSPFRIPIIHLATVRAAIKEKGATAK